MGLFLRGSFLGGGVGRGQKGGGGAYHWRKFCFSKMVHLIFGRNFVSENAVPEGMWAQGRENELPCKY